MKKLSLILSLLLIVCIANAQIFVGGSIGVGFSNEKNDAGEKYLQNFNLGFTPEIGYAINSKMDVGLDLDFGYQRYKEWFSPGSDDVMKFDSYSWGVMPFFQYHFVKLKKFDFVGRAIAAFGGNISVNNGDAGTMPYYYSFSIYPIIQYNLNKHFILFTDLNFISLNLGGSFVADGGRDFGFSFGADAGNIFSLNAIKIGCIYKF